MQVARATHASVDDADLAVFDAFKACLETVFSQRKLFRLQHRHCELQAALGHDETLPVGAITIEAACKTAMDFNVSLMLLIILKHLQSFAPDVTVMLGQEVGGVRVGYYSEILRPSEREPFTAVTINRA